MDSIIPQLIVNSIIAGATYSLIALGFNLIYGTTRFFNLAHGVLSAIGGYVTFFLLRSLQLGLVSSTICAVLFSGLIGYLLDRFLFRVLRKRKASSMVFMIASLGALTAIQAIIAILFTSQFQTLDAGSSTKTYVVFGKFGGIITDVQVAICIAVVLITGSLVLLLKRTKFGKSVRAVADEESVAKIVGINTDQVISRIFFIGSAIAGFAGVMVGLDTGIEPTMGLNLLLKGVIASIIGGIGSVWGAVIGSFFLGFVENFGIWKISGEWKDAIAFGVLLVFLLFRPQGIIKK